MKPAPPAPRRNFRVWIRVAALGTSSLLGLASCRQLVGFDEGTAAGSPQAGAAGDAGGYVSSHAPWNFSSVECGACVDRSCGLEAQNCGRDASCSAYAKCTAVCAAGDAACAAHCTASIPSAAGSPETWSLEHCAAAACRDSCGFWVSSKGQTCGSWTTGSPACAACCCPELAACDDDPVCVKQRACVEQCEYDKVCRAACAGEPDALNHNSTEVLGCQLGHCASKCLKEDWSCLGNLELPKPSGESDLFLWLTDYIDQMPLVGFDVKQCLTSDPACAVGLAQGTTDYAGAVQMPLVRSPLSGTVTSYFQVTGAAGSDYGPHLILVPASRLDHGVSWGAPLLSRALLGALFQPDPALGYLAFRAASCNPFSTQIAGVGAANLQVTVGERSDATQTLYAVDGFVSPVATATDASGNGAIVNIPPGNATVEARMADSGTLIATATVLIRPDTVTVIVLEPTASP